jgi:hypothetical protein
MFPLDSPLRHPAVATSDPAPAPPLTQRWSPASLRFRQQLTERYERGHLSLTQVHQKLSTATFQLLYRSQATTPLTPEQLHELVQRARRANAAAQITGLLLYADGHFVQLLEGPADKVQELYARISRDPRHQQIGLVSMGLLPSRQFAEWSMDFGFVDAGELETVLAAIGQEYSQAEEMISSNQLQRLLDTFVNS